MERVLLTSGSIEIILQNRESFKIEMLLLAAQVRCLLMPFKMTTVTDSTRLEDNHLPLQLLYEVEPSGSNGGYL